MEGSGMPCMVFNISYDILFYMNMGKQKRAHRLYFTILGEFVGHM
jgi:hypothetical protein